MLFSFPLLEFVHTIFSNWSDWTDWTDWTDFQAPPLASFSGPAATTAEAGYSFGLLQVPGFMTLENAIPDALLSFVKCYPYLASL